MNTQLIIRCLSLLASTLGRKYGVTVEIGGAQAYTDGKTIRLPSLPAEADQTFLGLVRGYLDHEAAHVRFTDFELVQSTDATPLLHHVWNILEDWRIERQMAVVFPGCADNFKWLIWHVFGTPTPSQFPIIDWLLLTVRSWAVPQLQDQVSKLAKILDAHYPNVRQSLEVILEDMLQNCPDTAATLKYATQIVEALKQHARTIPQEGQNQSSIEENSPANKGHQKGKSKQASLPVQSIEAHLSLEEVDLPQDISKQVAKVLGDSASQPNRMDVAVESNKEVNELSAQTIQTAQRYTSGMRHRLHGLLQSTQRRYYQPVRIGKVATKLLHRIAVQNPHVFQRQQNRPAINTAVHILLDASSSMRKRMELAAGACFSVAHALQHAGINVGITAFPGGIVRGQNLPTVTPLLRHGDRLTAKLQPKAVGCTPLAEALWWLLPQLQAQQERRKLLLIITDGKPDDMAQARQAIATAMAMGVEVIGLGILSPNVHELLPGRAQDITDLRDLAPAMIGMLEHNLVPHH